ncbi:MAG: phosphoribosylamine--glycine ligase [Gemmatimonadales bacterium]
MRVLVVGGGGREHALGWALQRDDATTTLFTAPGNPGTATLGTNLPITAGDLDGIAAAAREHRIDLVIVGPEAPLAAGLAGRLRAAGLAVFGPSREAAELESSKALAKEIMRDAGVPTAASRHFITLQPALQYISRHPEPLVVKASGLAAGKGAVVCPTRAEAAATARTMLVEHQLGDAGKRILVEEFLDGEELSVLALTDGEQLLILPPAQDHKRLGEGDTGPNTGGMGAYAPVHLGTPELLDRVRREVLQPVLRQMDKLGRRYTGVLYAGLMIAPTGTPYVLEFNCRFGDPETQVLMPVLPRGATAHLAAIATGTWKPDHDVLPAIGAAVTTVLAARGYPDHPETGAAIRIPNDPGPDVLLFHAGTTRDVGGTLRVAGGRVLNVTALAPTVALAAQRSQAACERVAFEGKVYRRDIAWREIQRAGAT